MLYALQLFTKSDSQCSKRKIFMKQTNSARNMSSNFVALFWHKPNFSQATVKD